MTAMTLAATGARGAELSKEDKELASSVFHDCEARWWSESLFMSVASVAPVATNRWPLEGTRSLLASHFRPESRNEEVLRDFEEHFDRERFQKLQSWCAAKPAATIFQTWIPAPTLDSLRYPGDKPTSKDPRWQIARRVAHAQRAPQRAEGITAVWMEAFAGGLKEGLAQVGGRAEGEKMLAEVSQSSADLKKEAAGLDDAVTAVYLQHLKTVPEKDLESFAAFWESDLGRWYLAYQWEAGQRVLTRAARAAGLALAGVAKREILGQPLSAEQLAVTTAKGFGPEAQAKDDEDALLIAYQWCGPRVMIEGLASEVSPPVSTTAGPFAELDSVFEEGLEAEVNHEALWAWFQKHADRKRMAAFHKWCATDAAWRVLRTWPSPPTQKRLADFASFRTEASERRRKALERVIAAQKTAEYPRDVARALTPPFYEELRKGLTAAGIDADKPPWVQAPVEKESKLQVSSYYLPQMDEITNEDLEAFATFWESDLGRWFTALQWDGVKTLLEAGGRKAGQALAEAGAERRKEKAQDREIK